MNYAKAVFAVGLTFVAALFVGCGDGSKAGTGGGPEARSDQSHGSRVQWLFPSRPLPGISQRVVGTGARAAVVLWAKDQPPPRKAIVFLHGLELLPPFVYGDWLHHLVNHGNTVIYPVYEESGDRPEDFRGQAIAGISTGLDAVKADPGSVVAIGLNVGGAMAFDYAALARSKSIAIPRGVFAVYPGRNPPGGKIIAADLSRISAQTHLAVVAGPGDPIPGGNAQAHGLLDGAIQVPTTQKTFIRAPRLNPGSSAPESISPRPSFWAPADRLIARARVTTR